MTNAEVLTMSSGDMTTMTVFSIICGTAMFVAFGFMRHRAKMKALDVEALRIQKANLQAEVNRAVEESMKQYKERMQILEEIITSKQYALDEKISRIK